MRLATPCLAQVPDGLRVDGKKPDRRPVFGRHVRDGCPIGHRKCVATWPAELDKAADDAEATKDVGEREHQIGRRNPRPQPLGQTAPNNPGHEHGDGFAQHHRGCLDAAYAPPDDRQAIHGGGVAVHADQCVNQSDLAAMIVLHPHNASEVFKVDLVQDPVTGRYDPEISQCLLRPLDEPVPLAIEVEFNFKITFNRIGRTGIFRNRRVVHHKIHGNHWIDARWVPAQPHERIPHGGQIDQQGASRRIGHQHTGGMKGDLFGYCGTGRIRQAENRASIDRVAILMAHQVLQQHAARVWERIQIKPRGPGQCGKTEDIVGNAVQINAATGLETIFAHCHAVSSPNTLMNDHQIDLQKDYQMFSLAAFCCTLA